MSLRSYTWGLADAALSNGAVLKAAAGGLPQRVTTADLVYFGTPGSNAGPLGAATTVDVVLLSDGGALCTAEGPRLIVRFDATGGVLWSFGNGISAHGVAVDEAIGEVYRLKYPSGVDVFDLAGGNIIRQFATDGWKKRATVLATDQIWLFDNQGAAVVEEVDRNGNLTGRTLPARGGTTIYDAMVSEDGWGYVADSNTGDGFRRWLIADSGATLQGFGTKAAASEQVGAYWSSYPRGVWGDANDVFGLKLLTETAIDRFDPDTLVATERAVKGGFETGQIQGNGSTGNMMGLDANASFLVAPCDAYSFQRLDRRTQTAEWSKTFASAATLKFILIPGALALERDASFDERRTTIEYSLDGVTYVAATPGTPLSVAIPSGTTLRVKASMTNFAKPTGIAPYIGGDSGEGPTVIWDDGSVQGAPLGGGIAAGASLGGSIAAGAPLGGSIR